MPLTGYALQSFYMRLAEEIRVLLSLDSLWVDVDGILHTNEQGVINGGILATAQQIFSAEVAEIQSDNISDLQFQLTSVNQIEAAIAAELRETPGAPGSQGGVGARLLGNNFGGGGAGGAGGGGAGGGPGGPGPPPQPGGAGGIGIPGGRPRPAEFVPGGADLAVAAMSQRVSGPFEVGNRFDKHVFGDTRDSQPISSLHISEFAYFYRDQAYDGPLRFEGAYPKVAAGTFAIEAHLAFDKEMTHPFVDGPREGMWRWWSTCNTYSPTDGGYDTLPQEFPFDAHKSFPATGWGAGDGHSTILATNQIFGAPGFVFRPQPLGPGYQDLRDSTSIYPAHLRLHDHYAPVVGRVESYAAHIGDSHSYTQVPGPSSRHTGGTASGGLVYMPPEVDIAHHASAFVPDGRALSTLHILTLPGVFWGAGYPKMDDGGMATGYRWSGDTSGNLKWDKVTAAGAASEAMRLTTDPRLHLTAGLSFDISTPSEITSNQNDYAFAGGEAYKVKQRLSSDATRNITGLAGLAEGEQKILINAGSNNIVLKHQDAGSAAANRFLNVGGADLTLAANDIAIAWRDTVTDRIRVAQIKSGSTLPLTTKGDYLTHDGTNSVRHAAGADGEGIAFDSSQTDGTITRRFEYADFSHKGSRGHSWMDHFDAAASGSATGWALAAVGGGANAGPFNGNAEANANGVWFISTGTTTTGSAVLHKNGNTGGPFVVGGGAIAVEFRFKLEDLSTVTQEYDFRIGLQDANSSATPLDGIYLIYDRNSNTDFLFKTRNSGSETSTDTNVAVAADTWFKGRIEIDADGGEVRFYLDDSLVAAHATNIPTGSIGPAIVIVKSAGTTARVGYLDYYGAAHRYTTEV